MGVSFKMAIVQVTIFLFFVAFSGANPYPKGYKNKDDPTLNAFPWMVSLGYHESDTDQTWKPLCEGSILSDRIIITSKDCLDDHINDDMIIKNVETKLQIRVGDEEFNDNDEDSKVYFADGFRKHDFNVALIATNQTIELNGETVKVIELPEEEQKFNKNMAVDLAMWNADKKLEEDKNVKMPKWHCDKTEKTPKYQLCADMNTCKGSGASMVKDDGPLIGILGKDPSCENEVKTDETFERTFER